MSSSTSSSDPRWKRFFTRAVATAAIGCAALYAFVALVELFLRLAPLTADEPVTNAAMLLAWLLFAARLIKPVLVNKHEARLPLCSAEGHAVTLTISSRDRAAFKAARKAEWGDAIDRNPNSAG